MAEGAEAGRLEVEVVADASGFRADLKSKLATATQNLKASIGVTADTKKLREEISRAVDTAVKGVVATITVKADTSRLQAEVAAAAEAAERANTIHLKVEADTSRLSPEVVAAKEAAERAAGPIRLDVDVDSSSLADRVRRAGQRAKPKVDVDANVKVDTAAATRNLRTVAATTVKAVAVLDVLAGVGGSLAGLTGALGGVAGGLYAITAAALPAVRTLAVLPGTISAIVAAAATGMAGFSGLGAAVKALSQENQKAGAEAKQSAQAQRQAANQVEAAQRAILSATRAVEAAKQGVVDANQRVADSEHSLEQSARSLRDANEALAETYEDTEEAGVRAAERVADAEADHTDALKDSRVAQADLNRARKDAIEYLNDLKMTLKGAALDEEDASLAVERARKQLTEANAKDSISALDKREADLAYRQAVQRLEEVKERNEDLRDSSGEAMARGVEGAANVARANENLQSAQDRVQSSAQETADAKADQAKVELDNLRAIRDAQEAVNDAAYNVGDAQRGSQAAVRGVADAAQSLADAQQGVIDAQKQLADAQQNVQDSLDKTTTSAQNLDKAMEHLPKSAQDFARYLVGSFIPALRDVRTAAQDAMLPGVQAGLEQLLKLKDPVKDALGVMGGALGDMAKRAGTSLGDGADGLNDLMTGRGSGPMSEVLNPADIDAGFVGTVSKLGDAIGNAAVATKNLMIAADPLVQRFNDWLVDLTASWAALGGTSDGMDTLTAKFNDAGDRMATFWKWLGLIWTGLKNLGIASEDAGDSLSGSLMASAERFADWSAKNQASIKEFFDKSAPLLAAVGRIILDIALAMGRLAKQDATRDFIDAIENRLGPALGRLFDALNQSGIGEKFVGVLSTLLDVITNLVNAKAFGGLITALGWLADALKAITDNKVGAGAFAGIAIFVGMVTPLVAALLVIRKLAKAGKELNQWFGKNSGLGSGLGKVRDFMSRGLNRISGGRLGSSGEDQESRDTERRTKDENKTRRVAKERVEVFWNKSMPVYITRGSAGGGADGPDSERNSSRGNGDGPDATRTSPDARSQGANSRVAGSGRGRAGRAGALGAGALGAGALTPDVVDLVDNAVADSTTEQVVAGAPTGEKASLRNRIKSGASAAKTKVTDGVGAVKAKVSGTVAAATARVKTAVRRAPAPEGGGSPLVDRSLAPTTETANRIVNGGPTVVGGGRGRGGRDGEPRVDTSRGGAADDARAARGDGERTGSRRSNAGFNGLSKGAKIAGGVGIVGALAGGLIGGSIQDGRGGARDIGGGALAGAAAGAGTGAMIGSIIPGIGTGIGAAVGGAIGGIKGAADGAGGFGELTKKIKAGFEELWPKIVAGAKELGPKILQAVKDFPAQLQVWLTTAAAAIKEHAPEIWAAIVDEAKKLPGQVWSILTTIVPVVLSLAGALLLAGGQTFGVLLTALGEVGLSLLTYLGGLLGDLLGHVAGWGVDLLASWGKTLGQLYADGVQKFEDIKGAIVQKLVELLGAAVGWGVDFAAKVLGIWSGVQASAKSKWGEVVGTVTGAFWDIVHAVQDVIQKKVPAAFDEAVRLAGLAWDKLKEKASVPINFVIREVYNNGIKKLVDGIASKVGLGFTLPEINEVSFRTGGVMPGYTPGRDVHSFVSPTAGRLNLSGGEGIIRPEATRVLGKGWIDSVNSAARRGGTAAVQAALGVGEAASGAVQSFANGGVMKVLDFGRFLRTQGYDVGENKTLGDNPRPGVHSAGGFHYRDNNSGAIDVNKGAGTSLAEQLQLARAVLMARVRDLRTYFFASDGSHRDHAHFDYGSGDNVQVSKMPKEVAAILKAGGDGGGGLGGFISGIGDALSSAGGWAKGKASSAWGSVTDTVGGLWGDLKGLVGTVGGLPAKIASGLPGDSDNVFTQFAGAAAGKLVGGVQDWVGDKVSGFLDSKVASGGSGDSEGSTSIDGVDTKLPAKVTQWASLVQSVLGELKLSTSSDMVNKVLRQIKSESGGDPNAIQGNIGDINNKTGDLARGLMQVIGQTFKAYAGPYKSLGQYNPRASVYAGLNYASHKFGGNPTLKGLGEGHGYARGGIVPGYRPFKDTVNTWLSEGEGVLMPQVVRALGPDTIHSWNHSAARGDLNSPAALRASARQAAGGLTSRSSLTPDDIRGLLAQRKPVTQNIYPQQRQSEAEIGQVAARELTFLMRR